jgi:hypothetical protein
MPDNTEPKIIQDDNPIWGASAIGREIGLDRGAAYHLVERGLLPARHIGRKCSHPVAARRDVGRAIRELIQ